MENFRKGIDRSSLNPYVNRARRSGIDSNNAVAAGFKILQKET